MVGPGLSVIADPLGTLVTCPVRRAISLAIATSTQFVVHPDGFTSVGVSVGTLAPAGASGISATEASATATSPPAASTAETAGPATANPRLGVSPTSPCVT